jgi:integrase
MGLGSLNSVTLAQARNTARELLAKIKDPIHPIDPIAQRKQVKEAIKLEQARQMSFGQCALACMESLSQGWKNAKHRSQWKNTLESYVLPAIGALPVAEIDTPLVLKCIEPIWLIRNETANRVRGRIESVLDWAKAHEFRQGENPARWKGHLDKILVAPSKIQKTTHFKALPYRDIGAFMKQLKQCDGIGARALEFTVLTAARSGEVRGATWDEIDLDHGTWTIPAHRMKAGNEHRVALSKQAIALLKALPRTEDLLVFPSSKLSKPLSDMTLTAVLRRMNRQDITVHGFRSTFRDWSAECTNYRSEVAEMALAHTIKNKVEAAYRRGDLFMKRQSMMNDWADYCETIQVNSQAVISFRKEA